VCQGWVISTQEYRTAQLADLAPRQVHRSADADVAGSRDPEGGDGVVACSSRPQDLGSVLAFLGVSEVRLAECTRPVVNEPLGKVFSRVDEDRKARLVTAGAGKRGR
jgi:hypothetical protein